MDEQPVEVFIVDDEQEVIDGLIWLLDSLRIPSRAFRAGPAFLQAVREATGPVCAVLDMRMPGMSGQEVQQALLDQGLDVPLFFLSAHGDIPAAVNAMQLGASHFLQKPFKPQEFLDAINRVVRQARERFDKRQRQARLDQRTHRLSAREREVLQALVKGYTSKETAKALAISPKTVDVHRANVVHKMGVHSAAELQRLMLEAVDLHLAPPPVRD
jgi:two-component system response regulator FixJ